MVIKFNIIITICLFDNILIIVLKINQLIISIKKILQNAYSLYFIKKPICVVNLILDIRVNF